MTRRPTPRPRKSLALRRALAAALLGACLAHGAPGAAAQEAVARPPGVLRVMTFNIHAGHGDLAAVAEVVGTLHPDVVALQEVDVHWGERSGFADQARALAEATGMEVRFGPIYRLPPGDPADPPREFGVAVLSRLPVLDWENHRITRLSTQVDGPPALMPGFLGVTVDAGGGRPLRVFSTHLDYRPDPAVRAAQVLEMRSMVDAAAHPVILMGDLNASPDAPELQPLFGALRDAWEAGAGAPERDDGARVAAGFTYPAGTPDRRIDYILVSPRLRVVRSWVVGTMASDHHPVLAEVELNPAPPGGPPG